jgi:hypothetical protein
VTFSSFGSGSEAVEELAGELREQLDSQTIRQHETLGRKMSILRAKSEVFLAGVGRETVFCCLQPFSDVFEPFPRSCRAKTVSRSA